LSLDFRGHGCRSPPCLSDPQIRQIALKHLRQIILKTTPFGALLVYSGLDLLRREQTEIHPEKNLVLRLFHRAFPVTKEYVGGQFFVRGMEKAVALLRYS